MKTYAQLSNGVVTEIIEPAVYDVDYNDERGTQHTKGDEIPIGDRFTPEFVSTLVDVTETDPKPAQRWTYDGAIFLPSVAYQPSSAETLASNTAARDALLGQAALAIAPLQDAVDLEEATAAEAALLKKWKQYRVAVNRIDLTLPNVAWPVTPS
jgi:hypothetical protein